MKADDHVSGSRSRALKGTVTTDGFESRKFAFELNASYGFSGWVLATHVQRE
jgi:hypothetical protein